MKLNNIDPIKWCNLKNFKNESEKFSDKRPVLMSTKEFKSSKLQIFPKNTKNILFPPVKSNFQIFDENLREAIYHSVKNRPLGKSRTTLLPNEKKYVEDWTYGIKNVKSENIKYLIGPFGETTDEEEIKNDENFESKENKFRYSKSFNKNSRFGKKTNHYEGRIKDIIRHVDQPKGKERKNIKDNFSSADHVFHKATKKDGYGVKELLYQQNPSIKKNKILDAITHIHFIRQFLRNKYGFNIIYLYENLHNCDKSKSDHLPWNDVFNVIRSHDVPLCKEKCEIIIDYFKLTNENGLVNYYKFINIINHLINLPNLGLSNDECYLNAGCFTTTYNDQTKNLLLKCDEQKKSAAGLNRTAVNSCSLDNGSTVKNLIHPPISSWFGLNHVDYLLGRNKEGIRQIFTNIGFNLNDDKHFDDLFQKAAKLWTSKDNKVSVEAFKFILDEENYTTKL